MNYRDPEIIDRFLKNLDILGVKYRPLDESWYEYIAEIWQSSPFVVWIEIYQSEIFFNFSVKITKFSLEILWLTLSDIDDKINYLNRLSFSKDNPRVWYFRENSSDGVILYSASIYYWSYEPSVFSWYFKFLASGFSAAFEWIFSEKHK